MSAAADKPGVFGLDDGLITQAMTATQASGGSTLEFLEQRSGLGPVELTAALAHALDYPMLTRAELAAMEPAFDLLAAPEACVAVIACVIRPSSSPNTPGLSAAALT